MLDEGSVLLGFHCARAVLDHWGRVSWAVRVNSLNIIRLSPFLTYCYHGMVICQCMDIELWFLDQFWQLGLLPLRHLFIQCSGKRFFILKTIRFWLSQQYVLVAWRERGKERLNKSCWTLVILFENGPVTSVVFVCKWQSAYCLGVQFTTKRRKENPVE